MDYFPLRISQVFMKSCFKGEQSISKEELVESFLKFVSIEEKEILKRNLEEIDEDKSEILDVISSFKCHSLPTKENMKELIAQLGHQELIQRPKYVSGCWDNVFACVRFPTAFNMKEWYSKKIPTGRKVASLFKADCKNLQEGECLEHLKRFTKNLNTTQLAKFLQILTGSDIILVESIDITFSKINGLARSPFFRTCGPTMELPSTYETYNELAEEFHNIINNPKGAFTFTLFNTVAQ